MSESDDAEMDAFFAELESQGVLSAEAFATLFDDVKTEKKRATEGRLERADIQKPHQVAMQKAAAEEAESKDLRAEIADMALPQKIKLAMLGDATARMLLVTDTNRLVQQAVMNNPRMQESEVEAIASNPNVSDFVLRFIAKDRTWMKAYTIKYALVNNPKTPSDVAMKWIRFLNKNDLRKIAKSKNIPQLIAVTAKKRLAEMQKGK